MYPEVKLSERLRFSAKTGQCQWRSYSVPYRRCLRTKRSRSKWRVL